jgi:beta-glucanase (GH16 family)
MIRFCKSKFNNQRTPIEKSGWELTLFDDFDGPFDKEKWIDYGHDGWRFCSGDITQRGKAPLTYYSENNNVIENSILKQYNKKETTHIHFINYDGKDWGEYDIPYTIGMITSKTFNQQYGWFEIRSKMPNSIATWPAFWLTGSKNWPPEIDIYEWYGGRNKKWFNSTMHWGVDGQPTRGMDCWKHKLFDLTEDFHIYACEWSPEFIKIYFDGVLIRTFKDKKNLEWFNQSMIVIIGNGVEDDKLDQATLPNVHEVDYVKIYKKI